MIINYYKYMEIVDFLTQLGLNQKQANVYMALLELGTSTVHPIATKAQIKRPTAYLVLDELQAKGLVSVVPRVGKALYTAESPEKLLLDISKKQEMVKRFLPNMLALYNAKKEKPQVLLFEGKEGVRQVYQKIFEAGEVWFFGTIKEVQEIYPEGLKEFVKRTKEEKLIARDFLTPTKENIEYAKTVDKGPNYEIRLLPAGYNFPTDSAIFGNSVVFFSFRPQVFAVMITSQEISDSLRTLHKLAWQAARPMEKL